LSCALQFGLVISATLPKNKNKDNKQGLMKGGEEAFFSFLLLFDDFGCILFFYLGGVSLATRARFLFVLFQRISLDQSK
jgi:hypothetical protein